MATSTIPTTLVPELRTALQGRVVTPADPDYEVLRAVFYGGIEARPTAIVLPADAADVAATVRAVAASGVELAVRCGGHSVAGHSTTDGGIVLDLRELKRLDIDPDGRTAWAQAGLTAREYTAAVQAHGLVTGFGDTGSVGIGGITLGGGVGYLVRKHGLTIDSLLAAEVVTADGEVRLVDADHEPDLFWAVRGGGGNFGVATRFHYRLHELPSTVGGMLILPATAETVEGIAGALDTAPEELSGIANVMPAPPMPFLAPEHHGSMVVFAVLAYAGDAEAGQRAMAPFRALATPLADMLRPMAYSELFPPDDPDYHPTAASDTMFVDRVGPAEARLIMDRLAASDAPMRAVQLRALGGAMARVPADATAFAHRDRRFMVNVAAFYSGEADRAAKEAWVAELSDGLRGADRAAYVNFLASVPPERVREAYPGLTWDRLRAIKRRYDPADVFDHAQHIPPAAD